MYFNSCGERVSRARWKAMYAAFQNRQELIKAGLMNRRDLLRMGLLSGAGLLVAKSGLSARGFQTTGGWFGRGGQCASPATTPFTLPLPIPPVKQPVAWSSLTPAPSIAPNTAINPATGLQYEGRTRSHQGPALGLPFPTPIAYQVTQRLAQVRVSNQLPLQNLWTFDGSATGPTYLANYGQPVLIRNVNQLPADNGGFGMNSVSTHLHNGHTPSESDGFPGDFFAVGQYYDQYYPNALAGFKSTHAPTGDINEALSTLWYHDHRLGFTAQNVYKGLAGFYLLFNQYDTGNETTGFRLPSFPAYDIPMMFADRVYDCATGMLAFDAFNLDGILGDKFQVNGVIQPVLHVSPRRYRFRWLNSGPSRFMQLYLTDLNNPGGSNPVWQISNDGNLLPGPVQVPAVALGVAERSDVIIDFSKYAGRTLYIENRLEQDNGRGPTGNLVPGGMGDLLLEIVVDGPTVVDASVDPATAPRYYALPSVAGTPTASRSFDFDQDFNGQWSINGRFFNGNTPRFVVTQNTMEQWRFTGGRGWSHPIHVHFEEFQMTAGAPGLYGSRSTGSSAGVNLARKDTVRIVENGDVTVRMRFRDFTGRYVMHCHNTIHEDHAMMLRFDIRSTGDTNSQP